MKLGPWYKLTEAIVICTLFHLLLEDSNCFFLVLWKFRVSKDTSLIKDYFYIHMGPPLDTLSTGFSQVVPWVISHWCSITIFIMVILH